MNFELRMVDERGVVIVLVWVLHDSAKQERGGGFRDQA
jgi:hypothetical protein